MSWRTLQDILNSCGKMALPVPEVKYPYCRLIKAGVCFLSMTNPSLSKNDLVWRVSVATYNQVIFRHPEHERMMLALERRATVLGDGSVNVRAHPFGGGVHILNPVPLQKIIGQIQFDSERSRREQDFRILIPTSKWESIKQYCLHHLKDEEDLELETEPDRELIEEFIDTIKVKLSPHQYTVEPVGFVIENTPVQTSNEYATGQLTVRLYRVFRAQIMDPLLCNIICTISELYSDQELAAIARKDFEDGGRGRANTILVLPLDKVKEAYLALQAERRYRSVVVEGHELEESVLAILEDVDVPQYERM